MLHIYNSLTKKIEDFEELHKGEVGMYACGPTVYGNTHIGHGRKYVTDDILRRTLEVIEGLRVKHVQNVTDVGHLVSDGDEGEDKMEKGATQTGKTVWEVAQMYTEYFNKVMQELNVLPANVICKATEHVEDQIALIEKIMANGYAYDTEEAVYFDVTKFVDYGKMFNQSFEDKTVGARDEVETDNSKKNPADFVLWFKRVGKYKDHVMHWNSPWGDGFPGWHIECSAMSMKYLGEQFDIHTGGEDHLSIHHPNEIAQSEAGTGKKPFVRYWVHTVFLMVDGKKMGKSLNNLYELSDLAEKGFSPLSLRYYFLTTHYRKQMNFTWEGLGGAKTALTKLNKMIFDLKPVEGEDEKLLLEEGREYYDKFVEALESDLNTALALSIVWEMMKSKISDAAKKRLVEKMDSVLALDLGTIEDKNIGIPDDVRAIVDKREEFRKEKNWEQSDLLRKQLEEMGYRVEDYADGVKVEKI